MGSRYGREPFTVDVCADCGAVVADRTRHNAWHQRAFESLPSMPSPPMPVPAWASAPPEADRFRHLLFDVARDHLDPGHVRLEWSSGFSGRLGGVSAREWGAKFGWAQPDDTGQAMVYLAVGDIPLRDRLPRGQYDNPGPSRYRSHTLPDGSPAQVLSRADRLEMHRTRPDGSYVFAIVDATFRNNSLTPSEAALPTLEQLEAFVMDPRLVLPSST